MEQLTRLNSGCSFIRCPGKQVIKASWDG